MPTIYIAVGVDRVKGDEGGRASLPLFLSISLMAKSLADDGRGLSTSPLRFRNYADANV